MRLHIWKKGQINRNIFSTVDHKAPPETHDSNPSGLQEPGVQINPSILILKLQELINQGLLYGPLKLLTTQSWVMTQAFRINNWGSQNLPHNVDFSGNSIKSPGSAIKWFKHCQQVWVMPDSQVNSITYNGTHLLSSLYHLCTPVWYPCTTESLNHSMAAQILTLTNDPSFTVPNVELITPAFHFS